MFKIKKTSRGRPSKKFLELKKYIEDMMQSHEKEIGELALKKITDNLLYGKKINVTDSEIDNIFQNKSSKN